MWSSHSTSTCLSKRNENTGPYRDLHTNIYSSFTSQNLETIQMPFNQLMDKKNWVTVSMCAISLHLCLTLCNPMDCSPLGSCPWDSPDKRTRVGCPALLQGIFLTQGSNLCLLHLPALAGGFFFTTSATWEPHCIHTTRIKNNELLYMQKHGWIWE